MIYVASPYSHPDAEVREERYYDVSTYVAYLYAKGGLRGAIYSPIALFHPIAKMYDLPTDFDWWQETNIGMLRFAAEFRVLMLEGWEDSKGVTAERDFALKANIPTYYVDPANCLGLLPK